jgi:hypothetical protein
MSTQFVQREQAVLFTQAFWPSLALLRVHLVLQALYLDQVVLQYCNVHISNISCHFWEGCRLLWAAGKQRAMQIFTLACCLPASLCHRKALCQATGYRKAPCSYHFRCQAAGTYPFGLLAASCNVTSTIVVAPEG